MRIANFFYVLIVSVILYTGLFVFILSKPMTVGVIDDYYDLKVGYLKAIEGRKIVLLAGSNGRFSHSCETIENETKLPCVNMSISAGFGLRYQFEKIKPFLNEEDIIYLPLEYGYFKKTIRQEVTGSDVPYFLSFDRKYLFQLSAYELLNAVFFFEITDVFSSLGEMYLNSKGIKRRYSAASLNKHGDETGHNALASESYKKYINNVDWVPPKKEDININSYSSLLISNFLHWASKSKVYVVGGLPTTFDDVKIENEYISLFVDFFRSHNQYSLILKNQSQYPRYKFFDTAFHLQDIYQKQHSIAISNDLSKLFQLSK